MDVQNGKFLTNKVLEVMNNFIDRLSGNKIVEDNSNIIND